eukprot:gene16629-19758_t
MTPEEKLEIEKRRREARKNRIQANAGGRLGFIADQVKDPTQALPPKKADSDDELDTEPTTMLNGGTQQQGGPAAAYLAPRQPRTLPDSPTQRGVFRWMGALLFGLVFASNAIILCSPTLAASHPLTAHLGFKVSSEMTLQQLCFVYAPIFIMWLAWEGIFSYDRQTRLMPFLKSDGLLVAFFYAVSVDLFLRFRHIPALANVFSLPADFAPGDSLIGSLYLPFLLSLAGQFTIQQLPEQIPLINMNSLIRRAYESISSILLMVINLLVFIDWWQCASCPCQEYGLLWLIANRSRGLLFWSHICINFASRILP